MSTKIPFADTTIVSEIDTDHEWFNAIVSDRVKLPGSNRFEHDDNKLTPAQVGVIIRGMQSTDALKNLSFEKACETARGRRFVNLRGKQYDFNLANYFAEVANLEGADLPLTSGQLNMVDVNVRALLGTAPHYNADSQAAIEKLSPEVRQRFVDELEACTTRGELNAVMRRYERRVPSPYELAREARSRATDALDALDINTEQQDASDSF